MQTAKLRLMTMAALVIIIPRICQTAEVNYPPEISGLESSLFIQGYKSTASGLVILPRHVTWQVYDGYRGIDEKGRKFRQRCVNVSLTDAKKKFLPVIVKMDVNEATQLHSQLEHIIAIKRQHPLLPEKYQRPISKISGMQCTLYVSPYKVSKQGKVDLPLTIKWRVYSVYFGTGRSGRTMEDCVLLVLEHERGKGKFWPLVSKMDIKAAAKLKDSLDAVIQQ